MEQRLQALGPQPFKAHSVARVHYERHRPEQTALYRLVQQHAATFFAQVETAMGSGLPKFVKDEFDAFLECGILAHGFLRLRCGYCAHDRGTTTNDQDVNFMKHFCQWGLPNRHPTIAPQDIATLNDLDLDYSRLATLCQAWALQSSRPVSELGVNP